MASRTFVGGRRSSFFELQERKQLTSEVEEAYSTMKGLDDLLDKLDRLIAMRQKKPSNEGDYNKEARLVLSECMEKMRKVRASIEEKKIAPSEKDLSTKAPSNVENTPTHSNDGRFRIR